MMKMAMLSLCQSARRRQWLYRRSARQEPSAAPDVEATCRAGRGPAAAAQRYFAQARIQPASAQRSKPPEAQRPRPHAGSYPRGRRFDLAFGFNVPVLIDPNGEVIDGAVRVEAAKLVGLS
jgi:hypothetical protein